MERVHAERSKTALIVAGATALGTQPPEEACEFVWRDVEFRTAYFDRDVDGTFWQPAGRWSDWRFPADCFRRHERPLATGPCHTPRWTALRRASSTSAAIAFRCEVSAARTAL